MSRSQDTSAEQPRRIARPQTTSRPKPAADPLEHLRKLTATLRGNLEKCAADPQVNPVHDLRTGTRRVQAMVEAMMRERSDTAFSAAAEKWLRLLKRMRRAAAPVRDLDVHRKLLHKLVPRDGREKSAASAASETEAATVTPPPETANSPATPVEQQAEHLDAWLHHARQHHSAELKKKSARYFAKFDALAADFSAAIEQGRRARRRPRSAALVALESFVRLAHEMQQLDTNNLHDFRKGAKKARYIAESAAEDAHALAIGAALKKLQDVIGDWHDWLVLADEALAAIGDDGKDLIAMINAKRDSHYVIAMKTVARLRGKLMGEWVAASQSHRRVKTAEPDS